MCKCRTCSYINKKIHQGKSTLKKFINHYADSLVSSLMPRKVGQTKNLTHNIKAAIQNGEGIIGYHYLHGVDNSAGGLKLKMTAKRTTNLIVIRIDCTWNDTMDPHSGYSTDNTKVKLARMIPGLKPTNYSIKIKWSQSLSIRYGVF